MAAVSGIQSKGIQSGNSDSIDNAVAKSVNVSDATQMENNFISLMVAQIKNQDPTSPVDSTEFLNQFSAMSQVKSLENMAALSKSNLVLQDNLQTLTAAGLVGQEVKVAVDSLQLDQESVHGQIALGYASAKNVMTLTDSNGSTTELALGPQAAGPVAFDIDPVALGLAPGKYTIAVTTESGEYPAIEVSGVVRHVRVSSEGPVLDVTGVGSAPFYNITEFSSPSLADLM
jgi:flagellar basal-body rod modification protein FlgD